MVWTNWSGGQRAQPRATVRPLDEAGVVAAVRRAAERGMRVRPIGAGTSWSPLPVTDDVAIDCSALTGVVSVETDRVRVRAGATLRLLFTMLAEHDLTLAAVPGWDEMTVAGAAATGTHGSGAGTGSISSLVLSVRLVDGTGTVRRVGGPDLDAVRCGLGALGVLTEIDLAVVPARPLEAFEELRPLDEVLDDSFLDTHHWAEIELYPDGQALVRWADPLDEAETTSGGRGDGVRAAAAGSVHALGRVVPRLAPALRRSASRWSGSTVGPAHEVLVDDHRARVEVTEWAVPREVLGPALRALEAAVQARGITLRMPVQVRVGAAETGWLHPATGRRTAWVAVRVPRGSPDPKLFGLVGSVFTDVGGRPHWAGRHDWTIADVEAAYPGLPAFRQVRDRFDPERRFANPHLDAVLGP